MPSLRIPKDLEVLRFLSEPRTRYEVSKHFGDHYSLVRDYLARLEKLRFVFVVKVEPWHSGEVKHFLITAKGRAILRGYEEAERRG